VFFVLCLVVGVCVADPPRRLGGFRSRRQAAPVPPVAAPEPPDPPQSLEGVLVRQVFAGEITRACFRHEMQRLAARDARRHPLVVPQDQ
jgi:hypothetical protein